MKRSDKKFRIAWDDNSTTSSRPSKPSGLLREYRIKFEKVAKGKKAVPDPNKLGIRSKLGGEPDWVQYPEVPKCRECKQAMTFIAHIDSMEHDEPHNPHGIDALSGKQEYVFGDVGMIYVFMCSSCLGTKSILQCG